MLISGNMTADLDTVAPANDTLANDAATVMRRL
jgi:hypothetical protein